MEPVFQIQDDNLKIKEQYVLDHMLSFWYLWDAEKTKVLGIGENPAELVDKVINKGDRLDE